MAPDMTFVHTTYPLDDWAWQIVCRLKPLEAARRLGVEITPEVKKKAKEGDFYATHNKGCVVLGPKDMGAVKLDGPAPKGTRALYCADGRHFIIEKA
jgi:hypothetical protein